MLFNSIAPEYDRFRPGYPDELFDELGSLADMSETAQVLEVGCGTGQATQSLLEHGWRVLALEPRRAMADRARERFKSAPFVLEPVRFEDWEPTGTVDLVFSATAFHWVDPNVRWSKSASILNPGGHIALATHRTVAGGTFDQLYEATRELHANHGVSMDEGPSISVDPLVEAMNAESTDIGRLWGVAEPKAGSAEAGTFFGSPIVRSYRWEHRYEAGDAVGLLSTFSPYLAVAPDQRVELLRAIETMIIERFGGTVSRRFVTILAVAPASRVT
jgi:SAM-dependent methyltransferase